HVNDSIYDNIHSNLFSHLKIIENEIVAKDRMAKTRMYIFFGTIIGFIFLLGIFFFRLIKIQKSSKIQHSKMEEKDKVVEDLTIKLQKDKNEDLLYIAQHRPAEFPEKFNEVYGGFVQKLLEIEP